MQFCCMFHFIESYIHNNGVIYVQYVGNLTAIISNSVNATVTVMTEEDDWIAICNVASFVKRGCLVNEPVETVRKIPITRREMSYNFVQFDPNTCLSVCDPSAQSKEERWRP